MNFISKENVDNLHKFIATQIKQKINVDIELDTKYNVIINNLVKRIHTKKNANFDKSTHELNKIALDTIVPFLIKTIEKNRVSTLSTVDRVSKSKEENIYQNVEVDYSKLGNNNVSDLDNNSNPDMFNLSNKLVNRGTLLEDSSFYNENLDSDDAFFQRNLKSSELKQPESKDELKRNTITINDLDKANLIDTYDETYNVSATVAEHEKELLGNTENLQSLSLKTGLSTSNQNLNRDNKMVVLDLYSDTIENDTGAFAITNGIDKIICTLQQSLTLSRPCDVYIEYILMHNLIGLNNNTPFELFHSFALTISELNITNYSNLNPFSGKFIIPNELYGLNDKGEEGGNAANDATSYVLRLKSNYVCRIDPKKFTMFTITLEGLAGNGNTANTTLTKITGPTRSTGQSGLTWTFTKNQANITANNHGFITGDTIIFHTVPTGMTTITVNTILPVTRVDANNITVGATPDAGGTVTNYTGGTMFTDSRLQIGLLFKER